ncbi:MAG: hypothetical protein F7B18_02025 [Desulfurococcales archaeon]|nr:hypothetical protein [Desulfurococcales archaeon]
MDEYAPGLEDLDALLPQNNSLPALRSPRRRDIRVRLWADDWLPEMEAFAA